MAVWAWPVMVFGAILILPALARRMFGLAACFAGIALLAAFLATSTSPFNRFVAPLLLLLISYWSTAPFYTQPSATLEAWLVRLDDALEIERRVAAAPAWLRALAEVAYIGCYPFMIAASLPAFRASPDAFAWHWTMVLSAELACYVTLPWLQARPPRELERGNSSRLNIPGWTNREYSTGKNFLRALNHRILDRLSVRATTIPSGHVAGPIAASLSAWMIAPDWGPWLLAGALVISAATVVGRYHYTVDALLGLAAGAAPPAIRAFWL